MAHDESPQGHQGNAHGGGGHEKPNDSQRVRGVILGHELALKGDAKRQQEERPQVQPSESTVPSSPQALPLGSVVQEQVYWADDLPGLLSPQTSSSVCTEPLCGATRKESPGG